MKRQTQNNYYLYDTQVENLFISEYMTSAPGDFVKVYLLGLMFANTELPADNEMLAAALALPEDRVAEAWDYWEEQGLVLKSEDGPSFVNLKEKAFGRSSAPQSARSAAAPAPDNKELKQLFARVQQAAGRLLEPRELDQVSSWVSDYNIAPELIVYCYDYCRQKGKSTRWNYVGAILKDWKAKGISSLEELKASTEIEGQNQASFRRIFRALGFNRNPSEEERRIMLTWFTDYNCTLDEILEACKKTSGISSPNINYVNTVIRGMKDISSEASSPEEKVQSYYERLRRQNAAATEARRNEIFSKIPRIKDINEALTQAAVKLTTYMLSGNSAVIADIKSAIDDLNKEKKELLQQNGYGPDALEPVYTCRQCKDTGELSDGRKCSCYAEALAAVK